MLKWFFIFWPSSVILILETESIMQFGCAWCLYFFTYNTVGYEGDTRTQKNRSMIYTIKCLKDWAAIISMNLTKESRFCPFPISTCLAQWHAAICRSTDSSFHASGGTKYKPKASNRHKAIRNPKKERQIYNDPRLDFLFHGQRLCIFQVAKAIVLPGALTRNATWRIVCNYGRV